MLKMPEIKEIADYILKNRKKKAFIGWKREQLEKVPYVGVTVCDEKGKIEGIVTFEVSPAYKIVHINNILTTHPNAIKFFISRFREFFKGWTIQGNRRNRLVEYKDRTDRLLNKLEAKCNLK